MEQLLFELEEFHMMLETDIMSLNHTDKVLFTKVELLRILNNYKADLVDILKKYQSYKETH